MLKKFLSFFGICAWGVGAIGGFGTAVYSKSYFVAACVVALTVMAFPKVKEFYHELMD